MADDPIAVVIPKLEHGEHLLWVGKPAPMRFVLRRGQELIDAVGSIGLGIVVLIFLLSRLPIGTTVESIPTIVWIMIILIPLSLLRPLSLYWMAKRTIYAVTDRRAIILVPVLWGRTAQSYRDIQHVERRNLSGGRGDLIFARERFKLLQFANRFGMREIGFFGVESPQEVERLLLKLAP